jgi:hypothetical protein
VESTPRTIPSAVLRAMEIVMVDARIIGGVNLSGNVTRKTTMSKEKRNAKSKNH